MLLHLQLISTCGRMTPSTRTVISLRATLTKRERVLSIFACRFSSGYRIAFLANDTRHVSESLHLPAEIFWLERFLESRRRRWPSTTITTPHGIINRKVHATDGMRYFTYDNFLETGECDWSFDGRESHYTQGTTHVNESETKSKACVTKPPWLFRVG